MLVVAIWIVFVVLLLGLWGREVLALGALRRSPTGATRRDYQRFRRRTLGLVVLLVLAIMVHAGAATPNLDAQGQVGWAGMCFILVIWLLIIATRDFRDSLQDLIEEQPRATLEALLEIERLSIQRREGQPLPDHMMIPRLDFGPRRPGGG